MNTPFPRPTRLAQSRHIALPAALRTAHTPQTAPGRLKRDFRIFFQIFGPGK